MTTDLMDIVDVRYDAQEADFIEQFHGAKCPGLTNATDFCNFAADGANLCAEAHSASWWPFVACMYRYADPLGDQQMDVDNPLAHVETFDSSMAACAAIMSDYAVDELRSCVYGDEGAALREVSAAKAAADMDKYGAPIVWIDVAGTWVKAPEDKNDTRAEWKQQVVSAICAAYEGDAPASCASEPALV